MVTLSKTEEVVFLTLEERKQRLQELFADVLEAQKEQIEFLRKKYNLPEGEYNLRAENGALIMELAKENDDGIPA